jgi:hypothetical protein
LFSLWAYVYKYMPPAANCSWDCLFRLNKFHHCIKGSWLI